jgi:endonuclease G
MKKILIAASIFCTISTSFAGEWIENLQKTRQALELGQQLLKQNQPTNNLPAPIQQIGVIKNASGVNNIGQQTSREPGGCSSHYPLGYPSFSGSNEQIEKVSRRAFYTCESNYASMVDAQTKTPLWVAESLIGDQQQGTHVTRKDSFQPHPNLPKQVQASLNDYRGSGFDRGHMAPAADMLTEQGMYESFFMSNMVPQVGPNMNRGIWADLENMVRKWSVSRSFVLVTTGPIFEGQISTIGTSQVWVPTATYKIVLDPKTFESIAFIIPNRQIITRKTKNLDDGNPSYPQTQAQNAMNCGGKCQLDDFIVSMKTVEDKTGLIFYPKIPPQNRNISYHVSRMWHAK